MLLLEDEAAEADAVKATLCRAKLKVVLERVTTREGFTRALHEFAPAVILCDRQTSVFDAPAALPIVRAARPTAALILLPTRLDERHIVASLRAGAEDFVMKHDLSRLPAAIQAALLVRQPLERLTPRQLEVCRLVADGHSTREVARRLKLSAKTVETHRGEVMRRLGVRDVVGLVRYAVRVGLVPTVA